WSAIRDGCPSRCEWSAGLAAQALIPSARGGLFRSWARTTHRKVGLHSHLRRVRAEADAPFGQPSGRVDTVGAVQQNLEVAVRARRVTAVAHLGDLVTRPHALADGDVPAVDVAVQGDRAVGVP